MTSAIFDTICIPSNTILCYQILKIFFKLLNLLLNNLQDFIEYVIIDIDIKKYSNIYILYCNTLFHVFLFKFNNI